MTISAMTPIIISSVKLTSNMRRLLAQSDGQEQCLGGIAPGEAGGGDQELVFSLAWTSMVSSATFCWVTWSAGLSELASFMPSLKPLTAPPRSLPMLRSFLVPNTRAMMTRTINQCQMLKLPMTVLRDYALGAMRPFQGR